MNDQLKKFREQKAFKVPEGYFETIDDRLLEKIPFKESVQKGSWIDYLVYQLQLRFSIPALAVISLVAVVIYINLEVDFSQPLVMSDEEITHYLLEVYDDELEMEIYAMGTTQSDERTELLLSDEELMNYLYEEASQEELMEFIQNPK